MQSPAAANHKPEIIYADNENAWPPKPEPQ